jgi:hypothetical protein
MLRDEYKKFQDQIARSSRKGNRKKFGHFKEIQFSSKDWMMINDLNEELKVRHCHILICSIIIQIIDFVFSLSSVSLRKWRGMVQQVLLSCRIIIK